MYEKIITKSYTPRKLKGEIKYIMENLTCGIMRMGKDGGVKFIRARKAPEPEDYQFQELRQFTSTFNLKLIE